MENYEERRKADEQFRLKIVEQHGEIKALLSSSTARLEELSKEINAHTVAIAEIRYAMWGGPRESDVGLLEKHRKLARNWTIAVAVSAFVFSALGKLISPLYDKAVTEWIYNSPSEKWSREQARPKVRIYRIKETPEVLK
jgi:hypothetical protein